MTATDTLTLLDQADAVHQLAGVLADRTHVIVTVPPTLAGTLFERLTPIADRWYIDAGSGTVGVSTEATPARLAIAVTVLTGRAPGVVATIPKTVPARRIRAALGHRYPADGSKDIVMPGTTGDPRSFWPVLLVDAIAEHDPAMAATIHANDITRLS